MLSTKVALVTGSGTGIGKAIAVQMAKNGAKVAIASRGREHVERTAEELRRLGLLTLPIQMDVRKKSDVERGVATIVAEWGAIHILVNNAGISGLSLISDPSDSKWYDVIDTNLSGMYLVTKTVLKHMPDHSAGRVINISSVLGKFGVPGYTAYCAAKTGMIGFTRALALEVAPRKITVNALCPGWTDTEMARSGMRDIARDLGISVEEFRQQAMSRVPLGEMVEPEEVANLVAFLAGSTGDKITAQAISICGGSTQA